MNFGELLSFLVEIPKLKEVNDTNMVGLEAIGRLESMTCESCLLCRGSYGSLTVGIGKGTWMELRLDIDLALDSEE